jgi:hypothetical protein
MYPAEWRVLFGEDTDLIDGLKRVRSELDRVEADTFVSWTVTGSRRSSTSSPAPDNMFMLCGSITELTTSPTPMATIDGINFHSAPPPRTMAPSDHPREHE